MSNPVGVPLAVAILAAGSFDPIRERPKRTFWHLCFRFMRSIVASLMKFFGAELLDRGPCDPDVQRMCDVHVGGERVLDRIVRACRDSERLASAPIAVAVQLKEGEELFQGVDMLVGGGETISDSLRHAAAALPPGHRVLAACGDLPLLSGEAIDDFLNQALAIEAELCVGYVERSLIEQQFPGLQKTSARLFDGTVYRPFCAAGLVLIDADKVEAIAATLDTFFAARKSVVALAGLLGLIDPVLYLLGRYSLERAKDRFAEIFDVTVGAVESVHGSICIDIDDKETYQYVHTLLRKESLSIPTSTDSTPDEAEQSQNIIETPHYMND